MARDDDDFTDDLFEPFELEQFDEGSTTPPPADAPSFDPEPVDTSQVETAAPPIPATSPEYEEPEPTLRCPSCGSLNPVHNRHCEECGARLAKGPLPVAPPPMVRSTPGGRALSVLLGVLAIVALIALFLQIFGGNDPEEPVADGSTTTTTSGSVAATPTVLQPASVETSSNFPSFTGDNLIDSDPTTYWNDNSQRGVGATITFTFAQPVAISEIEIQNIQDSVPFRRNYRIKDIQITVDDLAIELPYQLPDSSDPFRAPLATLETRTLTITVLETYPGEPVGDRPPFTELALAEVRFFGVVATP